MTSAPRFSDRIEHFAPAPRTFKVRQNWNAIDLSFDSKALMGWVSAHGVALTKIGPSLVLCHSNPRLCRTEKISGDTRRLTPLKLQLTQPPEQQRSAYDRAKDECE